MKQTNYWLLAILVLAIGAGIAVTMKAPRKGLDIEGGMRIILRAKFEELPAGTNKDDARARLAQILPRRVSGAIGVQEAPVHTKGEDQFVVELPGFTNEEEAMRDLQTTARLSFLWLKQVQTEKDASRRYTISTYVDENGDEVYRFQDTLDNNRLISPTGDTKEEYKALLNNPDFAELIVTGDSLMPNATISPDSKSLGNWSINIEFDPGRGGDKWGDFVADPTKQGEIIAISMDDKILSAPHNNITQREYKVVISGGGIKQKDADKLRNYLNSGALPVSLEVLQVSKIEPTLGKHALDLIVTAGIVSAGIIVIGMLFYYLLPGFIACIALGLYVLFCYAVFKLMNVTFSLAGIAGFILSIGMAVDANILIFERMKEELRNGKTLMASIDAGFKRAFTAIFDSNFCTIMTCAVLFYFGSDAVRGFATTLGAGVLISLFTAVTCTRTMLYFLVGKGVAQNPKYFHLTWQIAGSSKFDFVGRMYIWFAISIIIIIPGIIFLIQGGLKPNIEFRGGTEVTYKVNETITMTAEEVQNKLKAEGIAVDSALVAQDSNVRLLILKFKEFEQKDPNSAREARTKLSKAINDTGIANLTLTQVVYNAKLATAMKNEEILSKLKSAGIEAYSASATSNEEGNKLTISFTAFDPLKDKERLTQAIQNAGIANLKLAENKFMEPQYNSAYIEPSVEAVGQVIRAEMVRNAVMSVIIASILIMLYITVRYAIEGGWSGLRFGAAAIIATSHDVLVMVGVSAIFGAFFGWEISGLFITALLTMIGFSVHDTVVIFDRVRENMRNRLKGEPFSELVNRSIIQSFARSIITSMSVLITVFVLFLIGSATPDLKHFHAVLLVGLISGTYSSIFNAAQILVLWERIRLGKQKVVVDKPLVSPSGGASAPKAPASPKAPAKPSSMAEPSNNGEDTYGGQGERESKDKPKAPKKKRRM